MGPMEGPKNVSQRKTQFFQARIQKKLSWCPIETWDVYVDDDGLDQLSPVVAGGGQQPPLVLWQEIVGEQNTGAPVVTVKGKR